MGQAERAVHMSGALSAGPSLLETECASRLDATLHPGLRHLLRWLADCRPRLAPLASCADELYLLLSTLLHYHYLHEKGQWHHNNPLVSLDNNALCRWFFRRVLLWIEKGAP